MERLAALSRHVLAAGAGSGAGGGLGPASCSSVPPEPQKMVQKSRVSPEEFKNMYMQYAMGAYSLITKGEYPPITNWELSLASPILGQALPPDTLDKMLSKAEQTGDLKVLELLPGPWRSARTRQEKIRLLEIDQTAWVQGNHLQLYAGYQMKFGDRGLASNIAVPSVVVHSLAGTAGPELGLQRATTEWGKSRDRFVVIGRVLLADPADAARISRIHVRKEPNFGILYNSVISTTDTEHWKQQRDHLTEVFLPQASLSKIMPVSLARARSCATRLGQMSKDGDAVDMSSFLLHEAQAQLQLALLGMPEEFMESTNADIRNTFMAHPDAEPGRLSSILKDMMGIAADDKSSRLPSDFDQGSCPVRAPLSRAIQKGDFTPSCNYGNMLLILFAGHDTTGHTMTWLMLELARNPELQGEVQAEVDAFFDALGGRDPAYGDLKSLDLLDRCVTETLRLWPAVANGTFRQLMSPDSVSGLDGSTVDLPKDSYAMIANWSRHRNPDLWGLDADKFNPRRDFQNGEVAHVGCPMAGKNPQSDRFSPFAHNPRSCLGKNFAQMEMRLILAHLLHQFSFSLAPPYDTLKDFTTPSQISEDDLYSSAFRGVNVGGTMGPLDLELRNGKKPLVALKLRVTPRSSKSCL